MGNVPFHWTKYSPTPPVVHPCVIISIMSIPYYKHRTHFQQNYILLFLLYHSPLPPLPQNSHTSGHSSMGHWSNSSVNNPHTHGILSGRSMRHPLRLYSQFPPLRQIIFDVPGIELRPQNIIPIWILIKEKSVTNDQNNHFGNICCNQTSDQLVVCVHLIGFAILITETS
jgi:hypothetical protein